MHRCNMVISEDDGPIAVADRIADRANRESSGDPHPQFCEQRLLCRTEASLESRLF